MKKIIAIVLAMMTVFSYATVAFAENTTTLTTTVPDAEYTLNIPEDQEITFGATETNIGNVTVTDSSGFAEGKDLHVTITYDDFKAEGVSTTIPYYIQSSGHYWSQAGAASGAYVNINKQKLSGSYFTFKGQAIGKCKTHFLLENYSGTSANDDSKKLNIIIDSTDWGKALAGDYSTTITFTAEVVAETPTT